eukprot:scaffold12382_cov118-Isochrysis_galbana.AAC.10
MAALCLLFLPGWPTGGKGGRLPRRPGGSIAAQGRPPSPTLPTVADISSSASLASPTFTSWSSPISVDGEQPRLPAFSTSAAGAVGAAPVPEPDCPPGGTLAASARITPSPDSADISCRLVADPRAETPGESVMGGSPFLFRLSPPRLLFALLPGRLSPPLAIRQAFPGPPRRKPPRRLARLVPRSVALATGAPSRRARAVSVYVVQCGGEDTSSAKHNGFSL